jgi:hypothetical protein
MRSLALLGMTAMSARTTAMGAMTIGIVSQKARGADAFAT